MNLQTLTAVFNLIALIGGGVYFVNHQAETAKYDPAPIVDRMAKNETNVAVLQTQYSNLQKTVDDTAKDVKEVKSLLYEQWGYNKPARTPDRNNIITGLNQDGSPKTQ